MINKKRYFNLIEIALAVAVIAVGISSVMVLFPVGLNSTADAAADSRIPDAVEYMMTYLEAGTLSAWKNEQDSEVDNKHYSQVDQGGTYLAGTFPQDIVFPATLSDVDNDDFPVSEADLKSFEENQNAQTDVFGNQGFDGRLFDMGDGCFLFRQNNSDSTSAVFSAFFRVAKKSMSGHYFADDSSENLSNTVDKDGVSYFVELSYPANYPYESRTKLLYRMDVYNQARLNQ